METKIEDVKETIREKIVERYGSMPEFLQTDFAKSLGKNLRTYLYGTGSVSLNILSKLCTHFNMGDLSRTVKVTRTTTYKLTPHVPTPPHKI